MEPATLQALAAGAVTGVLSGWTAAKMWLRNAEHRFTQVEDHETRLTVVEKAIVPLVMSVQQLTTTVGQVASDVSYLRGRADEKVARA